MEKINDKLSNWASMLEPEARLQAERTARLPVVNRLALMPDAHFGMGATVGSVMATGNVVVPAAVGVDIGCGMIAVELGLTAGQLPDNLTPFLNTLEQVVPAGVGKGHINQPAAAASIWARELADGVPFWTVPTNRSRQALADTAATQLGSLGSGNHFFEVCLDEHDAVWVVLHSGSRGIGNQLAQGHIRVARQLAKADSIHLEDADLAYLTGGTAEFNAYIHDMLWAQDYARINREVMMNAALDAFREFLSKDGLVEISRVNCHHNFTQREVHQGESVWVTRKGAIKADVGDLGVIPGSMGTRSYIVKGLGNEASLNSCSHGAGRRMSRSEAKRRFTTADLAEAMEGKTWLEGKAESLIDEIPASYKDIDQVMADQADLCTPVATLHQILNYKGA